MLRGACALCLLAIAGGILPQRNVAEDIPAPDDLAVLSNLAVDQRQGMLGRDAQARLSAANARDLEGWRGIQSLEDWKAWSQPRIAALRRSLGTFPEPPARLNVRTTRTHRGREYSVDDIVFESRPGLPVTAHLYRPDPPRDSMPGIAIVHSHHNPKTQQELQDMGVLWARAGCLVLVMDQIGHGERRQHPFRTAADFPREAYRPSRQDYYFRYNLAVQLQLAGDSLMGWMVYDIHRGVDLLLQQPGVDATRIILLGSVAGGGDPCAVAGALDERITCVVPFNFGGPQPESQFPLPEDAESRFLYSGSGSWESTRNLAFSVRDGFLPWTIVASVAPRRLVYAHEFSWDRERDPVWRRLERIFKLHAAPAHLAFTHGYGQLRQSAQEASHCNNIGQPHRKLIHEALHKWFDIPLPDETYRDRRDADQMRCLTVGEPERPLHVLLSELAAQRNDQFRRSLKAPPAERAAAIAKRWRSLLGNVDAYPARLEHRGQFRWRNFTGEKLLLTGDDDILVPALLLMPVVSLDPMPLVLVVAQQGKAAVLERRGASVEQILRGGAAVCLVDVRGTGETAPGGGRGRTSWSTSLASTELMLGQTLLGSRVRDVRSLLAVLRSQRALLAKSPTAIWGTSTLSATAADALVAVPHGISQEPTHVEPLGQLAALLTALFEPEIQAVAAEGGLAGFQSVLSSPFCFVPYDVVVPGAIAAGDIEAVVNALQPRSVWLGGLRNSRNQDAGAELLAFRERLARWGPSGAGEIALQQAGDAAAWLMEALRSDER